MKHNQFDREQRSKIADRFKSDQLEYDKKKDIVYCPSGKAMKRIGDTTRTTTTGFKQKLIKYQAKIIRHVRYEKRVIASKATGSRILITAYEN